MLLLQGLFIIYMYLLYLYVMFFHFHISPQHLGFMDFTEDPYPETYTSISVGSYSSTCVQIT